MMITRFMSFILSIVALFSGFTLKSESGIVKYRNMPYGLNSSRQIFDLDIPENLTGDANMVMYIHGGTWCAGSKDGSINAMDNLAKRGIISASINYRFCGFPDYVTVYDILDDITDALKRIKTVAAERGINIKGVMFNGVSAGAHLSLLYAYSRAEEAPIKPVAVVAKSPVADLTDPAIYDGSLHEIDTEKWYIDKAEWAQHLTHMTGKIFTKSNILKKTDVLFDISPVKYVNKNSVPTLIAHGTKDTVLPYSGSVAFDKKLTELGVTHEFITYNGAWHDLENCPEGASAYNKAIEKFIQKYVLEK
ncbi:MAG: alpha/beta hydrolase [Clostridia bacterium]|nr:alpha/beta hydrolase [Clostridia bacterium]